MCEHRSVHGDAVADRDDLRVRDTSNVGAASRRPAPRCSAPRPRDGENLRSRHLRSCLFPPGLAATYDLASDTPFHHPASGKVPP